MSVKLSCPRGTADILPSQIHAWHFLESRAREFFRLYAYREIRTPVFEESFLFKRSLGETTEVVNKQLLELLTHKPSLEDRAEAGFALRPEGTAPVVRAFNQFDLGRESGLCKFFYIAPMFRGERPQKGRLRQFHQIGAEALGRGADNPRLDAEMISLAVGLLKSFGVGGFKLRLNSLGSREDKAAFAQWLRDNLKARVGDLGAEASQQYERNVFRLLDSKDPACRAAIRELDIRGQHLSDSGRAYFEAVRAALDEMGVEYEISAELVRGLDYYTHTVFEISYEGLGAQDAIGAGGRYNGLVEQLGGGDRRLPGPVGAVGFALGMERILLSLEHQGKGLPAAPGLDVYVVFSGKELEAPAFSLLGELRAALLSADMDYGGRPLKKQFEEAHRAGARQVVVVGAEEYARGELVVKDMLTGKQHTGRRAEILQQLAAGRVG